MALVITIASLIIFIIFLIAPNFHPSAEETGRRGEDRIAFSFRDGRRVVRNIYLPKGNGHTVEIDITYVTSRGIFILECKNYKGWIFGDTEHAEWVQTLSAGRAGTEKHHFYNPIWQNRSHATAMREFLGKGIPLFPIVVFTGDCTFKDVSFPADEPVCKYNRLRDTMEEIYGSHPEVLTEESMDDIVKKLYARTSSMLGEEVKSEHVIDVRNRAHDPYRCPKCGGKLVRRTNRSDGTEFWGCSNYPRCHYTRRS